MCPGESCHRLEGIGLGSEETEEGDLPSLYPGAQPVGLIDRNAALGAGRGHVQRDHHGVVIIVRSGSRLRAPVGEHAEDGAPPVAYALVPVVQRALRLGEQRAQLDGRIRDRQDAVEIPLHEGPDGASDNLLRHQRNRPAYALSAGWPPRCAYSTFEPFSISSRLTRSIIPAIDFPSYTGSVIMPSSRPAVRIAASVCSSGIP